MLFNNNAELKQRTYSIKSYKKKHTFTFKMFFKYFIYALVLIIISGFTYLSMNQFI